MTPARVRLYPPFPSSIPRVGEEDIPDVAGTGYTLPAGVGVSVEYRATHVDAAVWGADAEVFRPERHMQG